MLINIPKGIVMCDAPLDQNKVTLIKGDSATPTVRNSTVSDDDIATTGEVDPFGSRRVGAPIFDHQSVDRNVVFVERVNGPD